MPTSKLVVNPGTQQAREVELKAGANYVGRAFANDIKIEDPSVSGTHCQIVVSGDTVVLRDLNSTNGTFVNRSQIQEANLENGQAIHLGGVELLFQQTGTVPVIAAPPPVPPTRPGMRLARASAPPPPESDAPLLEEQPEESSAPPPLIPSVARFCKFHPKSPARFLCNKCNRAFCDFCVVSRETAGRRTKVCRSCGVELIPLEVQVVRKVQRGFFATLPGAFIYPFRGMGSLVLIAATLVFAGLGFMSAGLVAIGAKVVFYGFLFLFMQNIIFTTTADETESLSLPDMSGLIGACFTLLGTILISFGLPIGLLVARFYEVNIPAGAIIAAFLLGCLYFPMAFLIVAMKDSVMAANPLIVIPSILKIPFQYLFASLLLMGVFGVRQLGSLVSGVAGMVTFSTSDTSTLVIALLVQAVWAFLSVYLLTVNIRILGLLYNANKEKLAWF